jgi:hypothetical protein
LRDYLLEQLSNVHIRVKTENALQKNGLELQWTGETINLAELAYGIWLTGQVNNGNATITEIMEWLEIHLHVKIGVPFRRWFSISKRKRISLTKYIDQIKAAILKRVDEENGMK